MRNTKLISAAQYYGDSALRPWSVQEVIKARVNREAEAMTRTPQTPLPRHQRRELRLTEVAKAAFARCVEGFKGLSV